MIEQLNPDKTYNLSAYIYVDRFFYGLFDDHQLEYKSAFSYVDLLDLKRKLSESGITGLKLNKVSIISAIPPAGLIEYDDFNFYDYQKYFNGKFPEEFLKISNFHAKKLKEQKLYSAFAIPKGLEALLSPLAQDVELCHVTKVLADYLTKKRSDSFVMLINGGYCSLLYQNESSTKFSNTFKLTGSLDAVYYAKKVCEALELGANQPLYIVDQDVPADYLENLMKYFTNASVIPTKNIEFSEALLCA